MRIKLMPVSIKVKEIKAAKRNWFSSICVNNKSSPKKGSRNRKSHQA